MQWRHAGRFLNIRISALCKQEGNHFHIAPGRRTVQRRFTCGILAIYLLPTFKKQARRLNIIGPCRRMQRKFSAAFLRIACDKYHFLCLIFAHNTATHSRSQTPASV